MPINYGREAYELTRLRLSRGQNPKKKSIDEMDLAELLVIEQKFLAWYPTHPDHPEREIKKHIYDDYIKPRIELISNVKTYLIGEQPPASSQVSPEMELLFVQNTNN